jgi:hypothetical protein
MLFWVGGRINGDLTWWISVVINFVKGIINSSCLVSNRSDYMPYQQLSVRDKIFPSSFDTQDQPPDL